MLGAGGGLGILLVQLAHAAGARVIAAARGRRKLDLVRELGADAVVDYSEPGWPEPVREATGGTGPDMVFDGVGGQIGRAVFEITARGGRFSAHGAPSGAFAEIDPHEAERRGVTVRGIEDVQFAPADGKRLAERALSEAAAGRIRPVIGQTFPLEWAADAHAAIEARSVTCVSRSRRIRCRIASRRRKTSSSSATRASRCSRPIRSLTGPRRRAPSARTSRRGRAP